MPACVLHEKVAELVADLNTLMLLYACMRVCSLGARALGSR